LTTSAQSDQEAHPTAQVVFLPGVDSVSEETGGVTLVLSSLAQEEAEPEVHE